jgi:hypothetical protein
VVRLGDKIFVRSELSTLFFEESSQGAFEGSVLVVALEWIGSRSTPEVPYRASGGNGCRRPWEELLRGEQAPWTPKRPSDANCACGLTANHLTILSQFPERRRRFPPTLSATGSILPRISFSLAYNQLRKGPPVGAPFCLVAFYAGPGSSI